MRDAISSGGTTSADGPGCCVSATGAIVCSSAAAATAAAVGAADPTASAPADLFATADVGAEVSADAGGNGGGRRTPEPALAVARPPPCLARAAKAANAAGGVAVKGAFTRVRSCAGGGAEDSSVEQTSSKASAVPHNAPSNTSRTSRTMSLSHSKLLNFGSLPAGPSPPVRGGGAAGGTNIRPTPSSPKRCANATFARLGSRVLGGDVGRNRGCGGEAAAAISSEGGIAAGAPSLEVCLGVEAARGLSPLAALSREAAEAIGGTPEPTAEAIGGAPEAVGGDPEAVGGNLSREAAEAFGISAATEEAGGAPGAVAGAPTLRAAFRAAPAAWLPALRAAAPAKSGALATRAEACGEARVSASASAAPQRRSRGKPLSWLNLPSAEAPRS
mmetsp:Transcript_89227/g.286034  ORF Transcript_89227/g.286034 Transcript_89227/m.286034 type:complete len:389 (-) Transcript_89227:359-1525(-)